MNTSSGSKGNGSGKSKCGNASDESDDGKDKGMSTGGGGGGKEKGNGGGGGGGGRAPTGAKVCLDAGCKSTTGVDGCSPSSGTQFVTGKCSTSTDCASGCCVGKLIKSICIPLYLHTTNIYYDSI